MATQILELESRDAVDVVDALNLAAGDYVTSNDGTFTLRLFEGAAAPASRRGHPIPPGGSWSFGVAAGDSVWIWGRKRGGVFVVSGS